MGTINRQFLRACKLTRDLYYLEVLDLFKAILIIALIAPSYDYSMGSVERLGIHTQEAIFSSPCYCVFERLLVSQGSALPLVHLDT